MWYDPLSISTSCPRASSKTVSEKVHRVVARDQLHPVTSWAPLQLDHEQLQQLIQQLQQPSKLLNL